MLCRCGGSAWHRPMQQTGVMEIRHTERGAGRTCWSVRAHSTARAMTAYRSQTDHLTDHAQKRNQSQRSLPPTACRAPPMRGLRLYALGLPTEPCAAPRVQQLLPHFRRVHALSLYADAAWHTFRIAVAPLLRRRLLRGQVSAARFNHPRFCCARLALHPSACIPRYGRCC